MTDDAIDAVLNHITLMEQYEQNGCAGYDVDKHMGGSVCLCVFDKDKYELKRKLKE